MIFLQLVKISLQISLFILEHPLKVDSNEVTLFPILIINRLKSSYMKEIHPSKHPYNEFKVLLKDMFVTFTPYKNSEAVCVKYTDGSFNINFAQPLNTSTPLILKLPINLVKFEHP